VEQISLFKLICGKNDGLIYLIVLPVKPKVRKTSQQTSSTDVKKKKMKDKSKKVTKCG